MNDVADGFIHNMISEGAYKLEGNQVSQLLNTVFKRDAKGGYDVNKD